MKLSGRSTWAGLASTASANSASAVAARLRRVMLAFCPRAGPSSSRCARLWTPPASLNGTSLSSGSGSGSRAAATVESAFFLNRLAVLTQTD